ncbi:MAG: YeeE/YedE family protein [Bacteroidota bacterium]
MLEWILKPWPWYVAGPLIGLTVPLLLIIGNKTFGISSSLRHLCAACLPSGLSYFKYDWKKESWNLFFVFGVGVGGYLAAHFLSSGAAPVVDPRLTAGLTTYGVQEAKGLVPADLFSLESLMTLRGFVFMVVGGFFVGFGTRYAGGCTSGHSIMGLSNWQWPSLVATLCFMAGGFLMANLILPYLLTL